MQGYQALLGAAGALVGLVSYVPYFRDMFRGTTKPHPFSWFVWGLVGAIAFSAQLVSGAGYGVLPTGITALACFAIAGFAVFEKTSRIMPLDVVSFVGALLGIVVWRLTGDPLHAVVIVLCVHFLGFLPTYRKAYYAPHGETRLTFILSFCKWALGLLALGSFTLTTALFPAGVLVLNLSFVVMVTIRRWQLDTVAKA